MALDWPLFQVLMYVYIAPLMTDLMSYVIIVNNNVPKKVPRLLVRLIIGALLPDRSGCD